MKNTNIAKTIFFLALAAGLLLFANSANAIDANIFDNNNYVCYYSPDGMAGVCVSITQNNPDLPVNDFNYYAPNTAQPVTASQQTTSIETEPIAGMSYDDWVPQPLDLDCIMLSTGSAICGTIEKTREDIESDGLGTLIEVLPSQVDFNDLPESCAKYNNGPIFCIADKNGRLIESKPRSHVLAEWNAKKLSEEQSENPVQAENIVAVQQNPVKNENPVSENSAIKNSAANKDNNSAIKKDANIQKNPVIEKPLEKEKSISIENAKIIVSKNFAKTEIKKIDLGIVEKKPVYTIQAEQQVNLFGFIPVSMQITTQIDSQTGSIEKIEKPWWSFLIGG